MIGISIAYITGYLLALWMMRVEHASEKEIVTIGDRVLSYIMAALSWVIVLIMLVTAWTKNINATGYWNKPLNKNEPGKEPKK